MERNDFIIVDQIEVFTTGKSPKRYPEKIMRIKYHDKQQDRTFGFLTNNFELPTQTIADHTINDGLLNCFSNGSNSI